MKKIIIATLLISFCAVNTFAQTAEAAADSSGLNAKPEPGYTGCFVLLPNNGLSINKDSITGYTNIEPSTNGKIMYFHYGRNGYGKNTGFYLMLPADSYHYPDPVATPQVNGNISIAGLKNCKVTVGVWIHPDYNPSLSFEGSYWYANSSMKTFSRNVKPGETSFSFVLSPTNANANFFFNFSAVHPATNYTWELDYIRIDYNK